MCTDFKDNGLGYPIYSNWLPDSYLNPFFKILQKVTLKPKREFSLMSDGHQRAEILIAWYQHRTGQNNGSNIRLESALVLPTAILMLLRFCQLITVQGIISDKAHCSVR